MLLIDLSDTLFLEFTTMANFTANDLLVDYWATPADVIEDKNLQLNLFDLTPPIAPKKSTNKHYACIDPLVLMLFFTTCLEHDMFDDVLDMSWSDEDFFKELYNPKSLIHDKVSKLLGISLYFTSNAFQMLFEMAKKENPEFELQTKSDLYRYSVATKSVYELKYFKNLKQVIEKINAIRKDLSIVYEEEEYSRIIEELDFLYMTSGLGFTFPVTQAIEEDLYFFNSIFPSNQSLTFGTSLIMPYIIKFVEKFHVLPASEKEFIHFLKDTFLPKLD